MERRSNTTRIGSEVQKGSLGSSLLLVIVSLTAVSVAAQLYVDGQDLQTSEKLRAALEENVRAANGRLSNAENAKADAEAARVASERAKMAADALLAKAKRGKEAFRLSLQRTRKRLAIAEHARADAENRLLVVTEESARLQSLTDALEAAASNVEKNQETAATQTLAASASVEVSSETAWSTPVALPSKLDRGFEPTFAPLNVPPETSTDNERTRMENCMAVWEPTTHMTKAEWRRTCRDTLSVDF